MAASRKRAKSWCWYRRVRTRNYDGKRAAFVHARVVCVICRTTVASGDRVLAAHIILTGLYGGHNNHLGYQKYRATELCRTD